MRKRLPGWSWAAPLALALTACGGSVAVTGSDGGLVCYDDNDCPRGSVCSGGICQRFDGSVDGAGGPPVMTVEPSELDFGSPLVGQEVVRSFTIGNLGDSALEIRAINLVDNDPAADDFTGDLGPIPDTLAPGETHVVTITLVPTSGDLDFGTVIIDSNDPADYGLGAGKKEVKLKTAPKGDAELTYCVQKSSGSWDDGCDYSLDFGTVDYGENAERVVKFWNQGTGNRVLTATADAIEAPPPNVNEVFTITAYTMNGDTEEPVTLPFILVAADPTAQPPVDATELFFRVRFTAVTVDGQVPGQNFVLSLEENPPGAQKVPLMGLVAGCRPGRINCDSDPGCETACDRVGATDTTCDGRDDDCNCKVDDGYVTHTCGVGACERTSSCTGGVESCVPGTPGSSDPCDNVDNDCDGRTDEDYVVYTCGQGACQAQSRCVNGVDSCTPKASTPEVCNNVDDNCDGTVDNGTATQLCGTIPNGTPRCASGNCEIASCDSGYFDLDGQFTNGCECGDREPGNKTCGTATDLGAIDDNGGSVSHTGNLPRAGDTVWFVVTANNSRWSSLGSNPYNVKIGFTANPGEFQLEVYSPDCNSLAGCGSGAQPITATLASDKYEWNASGEQPCNQPSSNVCANHGPTKYYIKVSRRSGYAVSCANFTIQATNGI